MKAFMVTQENLDQVAGYLERLAADANRFGDALEAHIEPRRARAALPEGDTVTPAKLNAWIETHLSSTGRGRMLAALRQRKRAQTRCNWRIDHRLYHRILTAAQDAGLSPEDWLWSRTQPINARRQQAGT